MQRTVYSTLPNDIVITTYLANSVDVLIISPTPLTVFLSCTDVWRLGKVSLSIETSKSPL